jgi:hypothetical protein
VESIIHDDDQGRIAIRPSADSLSADPSVFDKIRLDPSNVMRLVGMESESLAGGDAAEHRAGSDAQPDKSPAV